MKKKKKNKGKKSLTAVGAVVAAGLTPGIVTSAQAVQPPSTDVEFTAADVISINGDVFDFDELFAMSQVKRDPRNIPKVYGPPVSVKEKEERERQEALREAARRDSIRRAQNELKLVYGPPPPRYQGVDSDRLRDIIARDKTEAQSILKEALMDYLCQMPLNKDADVSLQGNLVRDFKMDSQQLEALSQEIEDRFGVQLTVEMIKQLGTPERIAKFIVEVAAPIKEKE